VWQPIFSINIFDCTGGWLNASSADWFEEYARLCFTEFGEEVKFWITFNEPKETSIQGLKNPVFFCT
jgi:beta-glucosidase/6-phospho-beta-glucosidase/beta-galactosidase